MNRNEVKKILIEEIDINLTTDGFTPAHIDDESVVPMQGIPNFDSLRSVEVTCKIEEKLHISLGDTVFKDKKGNALTLGEIIEIVHGKLSSRGRKK